VASYFRRQQGYSDLHAYCPIFLFDFNKIWNCYSRFHENSLYQISLKSIQRSHADARGLTDKRIDGRTHRRISLRHFDRGKRLYGDLMSLGSNKTYLGLHVKCPTFLSDINQFGFSQRTFHENPQY